MKLRFIFQCLVRLSVIFYNNSQVREIAIKGFVLRNNAFSSNPVSANPPNISISSAKYLFFHTEISVKIKVFNKKIVLLPILIDSIICSTTLGSLNIYLSKAPIIKLASINFVLFFLRLWRNKS